MSSKTTEKQVSQLLMAGPIYICQECRGLIRVIEDDIKRVEVEDEEGYLIEEETFNCPSCKYENIFELDIEDEEDDDEHRSRSKSRPESSSESEESKPSKKDSSKSKSKSDTKKTESKSESKSDSKHSKDKKDDKKTKK